MPKPAQTNRAVFLDRDGTLNEEVNLLHAVEGLRLLPGAGKAVARLNKLGFQVIVITNQPVVARGLCSEAKVNEIHDALRKLVAKEGGKLDGIYYCPHSKLAEVQEYRLECECRKPAPGLLKQAAKDHSLDLKASYMVGDMARDILAGQAAGCTTVLVQTGHAGQDLREGEAQADQVCADLAAAADWIAARERDRK